MSFFENTRKPVGLGGKIMVAMMNFGHSAMAEWGLSFLQPAPDAMVLDCGCGGQFCHACLLHGTPPRRNGTRIDLSRFFYADSRVVNAMYLSLGTQFQQLFDVRPTAAAAVQHHGIRGRL